MLSVAKLSVVMLSAILLSVILPNFVVLSAILLTVIMLSVILLIIILLVVILLNVILKTKEQTGISQYFLNSCGTACLHDNNPPKTNAKPFFSVACSNILIRKKTAYKLLMIIHFLWPLTALMRQTREYVPLIRISFLDVYELKTKEQTGISQYFLNSHGTAC
jgi:hypothetical protein